MYYIRIDASSLASLIESKLFRLEKTGVHSHDFNTVRKPAKQLRSQHKPKPQFVRTSHK